MDIFIGTIVRCLPLLQYYTVSYISTSRYPTSLLPLVLALGGIGEHT